SRPPDETVHHTGGRSGGGRGVESTETAPLWECDRPEPRWSVRLVEALADGAFRRTGANARRPRGRGGGAVRAERTGNRPADRDRGRPAGSGQPRRRTAEHRADEGGGPPVDHTRDHRQWPTALRRRVRRAGRLTVRSDPHRLD